ncbi:hypothetical protein [Paenibacillus humicus]|uniref:hypothetical protein n=1 Tax=Paenibacillus humicus TaxID=412861 RepID=UPI003D26521C
MAEKIKPYLFYTIMYPSVTKDKAMVMDQLLSVFDKYDKFIPNQWGDSELTKVDYNRPEILEKVINNKTSEVYLHRNNAVKYTAQFDLDLNVRSIFDFEAHKLMSSKFWPAFFDLSDELATVSEPNFGVTHIFWPPTIPWETDEQRIHRWMNLASSPVPVEFHPNGPLGVGMRTYFGGYVLEMFGRDFLMNTPAIVTELEWGGIRIDLSEKPWELELNELILIWSRVMDYLETSNVLAIPQFREDKRTVLFSPNEVWRNYLKK